MKINNIIIYVIVLIIVLLSFKIPEWILKQQEDNMEMSYYWEQGKSKVDVEAEKIYLVRAIHNIEDRLSKVKIYSGKSQNGEVIEFNSNEAKQIPVSQNLDKELLKLKEYNLIEYPKSIETAEGEYNGMSMIDRYYSTDGEEYNIRNIELILETRMYEIEREMKSGKILFISFSKEELDNTIDKETILRNYVSYLDLHIIDDWKYENSMLISEKAGLMVGFYKTEEIDTAILSIHTIDKYKEVLNNVDMIETTTVIDTKKN